MSGPIYAAAVVVVVVLAVLMEARRQRKKYGKPGTGTRLMREGLLDLQGHLQPDRKVEVLREQERKQDLLVDLDEPGGPLEPGPDR